MANFPPLKNYLVYCIERIIPRYNLVAPFLDVGCGVGDIAEFLSSKGWFGRAIDISDRAVREAQKRLENSRVNVACASVFSESGKYSTIFALDILEHIDNEEEFLRTVARLLSKDGKLILAIPSNKREWRWDDDFYGHVRRYNKAEILSLLERTGFRIVLCWDFTFPFFWFMRRIYTLWIRSRANACGSYVVKTQQSACQNAWPKLRMFRFLFQSKLLWKPLLWIQYYAFRHFIALGHEMIILAEKEMKQCCDITTRDLL